MRRCGTCHQCVDYIGEKIPCVWKHGAIPDFMKPDKSGVVMVVYRKRPGIMHVHRRIRVSKRAWVFFNGYRSRYTLQETIHDDNE